MHTILGQPCFLYPTAKDKNKYHTIISDEYECSFITEGAERMLKIVDNSPFYYIDIGVMDYYIINSATKTNRNLAKGISCLPFTEDGEPQSRIALTFFLFQDQIFLLEDIEGVSEFTLMKVTSENPEQDWRWLRTTLVGGTSGASA